MNFTTKLSMLAFIPCVAFQMQQGGACDESPPMTLPVAQAIFGELRDRLPRAEARMQKQACQASAELGQLDFLISLATDQIESSRAIANRRRNSADRSTPTIQPESTVKALEQRLEELKKRRDEKLVAHVQALQAFSVRANDADHSTDSKALLELLRMRLGESTATGSTESTAAR